MRRIFVAAMMLAGAQGVQHAQAADMPDYPLRGGYSDFGARRPIWEGFYVGGQVGEGWLKSKPPGTYNNDIENAYTLRTGLTPALIQTLPTGQGRKTAFGGFVGYNSQWEDVVVGVEANYLHSDVNANSVAFTSPADAIQAQSRVNVAMTDFGSLRLRGGYMMGSFLPYAYVGFAAGNADITRSAGATSNAGVPVTAPFETAVRRNMFLYGYSAGVGVDVMLIGGLFARAEYEYTQFSSGFDKNINSVRVGLGYKF